MHRRRNTSACVGSEQRMLGRVVVGGRARG